MSFVSRVHTLLLLLSGVRSGYGSEGVYDMLCIWFLLGPRLSCIGFFLLSPVHRTMLWVR
jgi:hypothetical protein